MVSYLLLDVGFGAAQPSLRIYAYGPHKISEDTTAKSNRFTRGTQTWPLYPLFWKYALGNDDHLQTLRARTATLSHSTVFHQSFQRQEYSIKNARSLSNPR